MVEPARLLACSKLSASCTRLPASRSGRQTNRLLPLLSSQRTHFDLQRSTAIFVFVCAWSRRKPKTACGRKAAESEDGQNSKITGDETSKVKVETGSSSKWLYLIQRLFQDMAKASASRRRDFSYWAVLAGAAALAIISDFLGIMRALLSLNPESARRAGLDQIYPVEGLKAFRESGRYQLRYPGDWLGDVSIAFSKQAAAETPTLRQKKRIIPDAAFGPAGAGIASIDRAQSLSVVSQPVRSESLESLLGEPLDAFARLSEETFASSQFGQSTELLLAQKEKEKYEFEYLVNVDTKKGAVRIHCWSSVAVKTRASASSRLYTMTLVVPEQMLTAESLPLFNRVWHSFELE